MNVQTFSNLKNVKIAFIVASAFKISTHFKNQVEDMQNNGMDVVLFSPGHGDLLGVKLGGNLRHERIEIERQLRPWKDLVALFTLVRCLRRYKFDITHSMMIKAGLLTAVAAYIAGVPVRIHTFTGLRWVTLNGFMRFACRLCDKIIGMLNTKCYADSHSQRSFLINEGIIRSNKLAVIGSGSLSGVNLKRFDTEKWSSLEKKRLREELAIPDDARVILFLGRIVHDKGVFELVNSFSELLNMNYDVHLLMVGSVDNDGGDKHPITIVKNSRIHRLQHVDCPEKYLSISDILCLPSYREGFSTVVIEAAAMAVPAVGTRISGLIDAIEDGKTGILVPSRDPVALRDALMYLLDNPYLIKEMGMKAKERVHEKFDCVTVSQNLKKEYLSLLNIVR